MAAIGMRVLSYFKLHEKAPGTNLTKLEKFLLAETLGMGVVALGLFGLGKAGLLNLTTVVILLLAAVLFLNKEFQVISRHMKDWKKYAAAAKSTVINNRSSLAIIIPLAVFGIWNLIGALSPEIEFDALWYHLTLPEIYVSSGSIDYVPGGLLYYSVFPRITEMLFTLGLLLANPILAKLFHLAFGVLWLMATYALGKRFFTTRVAALAILILATTFEFGWLARTAYVDLAQAFFGTMVTLALLMWFFQGQGRTEDRSQKLDESAINKTNEKDAKSNTNQKTPTTNNALLILAAISLGLLLGTKHWGLAIAPAAGIIILLKHTLITKTSNPIKKTIKDAAIFFGIAFALVAPWYLDAFIATGNPLYPLGSFAAPEHYGDATGPADWLFNVWPTGLPGFTFQYLTTALSPLLGVLLLLPFIWKKISHEARYLTIFAAVSYLAYSLIPTQYYRYSLSGVAPLALVAAAIIFMHFWKRHLLRYTVIFVAAATLLFNFHLLHEQNKIFYQVFTGQQTTPEFLSERIAPNNFALYDSDGYLEENFGEDPYEEPKLLTFNVHNAFYVDVSHIALANSPELFEDIETPEDFVSVMQDEGLSHILLKNASIESLWNELGQPGELTEFEILFEKNYDNHENKVLIYELKSQEESE